MNRTHLLRVCGLLAILVLTSFGDSQQPSAVAKEKNPRQDGIEVQTRGPMHEAFAQPIGIKPEPGAVVEKAPPPMVPEELPEQKPEAENARWIPGYWAWDAEKQDFLWVSGVYRVPPQDRTFVPGYWQHTTDGWRWVAGFWSDSKQQEVPRTPEPPEPLDKAGPSMPAPNDNAVYIPGSWVYRDSRFIWQPGYYAALQVGRVWVPAHYVWTPNGYLFVDGYWDYPLENRGLAFAPAYFARPLWKDPNWRYQPNYVINPDAFFDSAFIGPAGFYFGDYYDPFYARAGYRPWYAGRGRYDPLFTYHGTHYHQGHGNWAAGTTHLYNNRTAGKVARPPVTLAQHTTLVNARGNNAFVLPIVTPASQFKSKQVNIVRATPAQLQTQRNFAQASRQVAQNRSKLDSAVATKGAPSRAFRTGELSSSNVAVRTGTQGAVTRPTIVQSSPTPKVTTARVVTPQVHPRVVTPTQHKAAAPTRTPTVAHAAPQVHRAPPKPARTPKHAPARGAGHAGGGHKK
jgi:WXXGXW repeat (2 copies)